MSKLKKFTKEEIKEAKKELKKIKKKVKEEMTGKRFKLSFGIAIILIGISTILFGCNNNILIGISLGALFFIFTDISKKDNILLNTIPLFVIMLFGLFPEKIQTTPILKYALDARFNDCIVFLSLGLTIILEHYKSYKLLLKEKVNNKEKSLNYYKNINKQQENITIILSKTIAIRKVLLSKKIIDQDVWDAIKELDNYAIEEIKVSTLRRSLVQHCFEESDDKVSLDIVEKAIFQEFDLERNKESEKIETKSKKK